MRVWVDPPLENLRVENRLALGTVDTAVDISAALPITANEAIDKMIVLAVSFPNGCKNYAMDRTALSRTTSSPMGCSCPYGASRAENSGVVGRMQRRLRTSNRSFRSGRCRSRRSSRASTSTATMSWPGRFSTRCRRKSSGAPGTEEGGRQVVDEWLQEERHRIYGAQRSITEPGCRVKLA